MLRQVMTAQARWSSAVWFSVFLDQRISRPRKRFSQEWVRSMTHRRGVDPVGVDG